ncbi:MAG: glycine zipper 2TM domain-containing protein [Gammaproteobacteria bacterium]|nr:glycine zipper 2TM domain-containing protein [Gammaproteobacteria bacterium]
MRHWQVISTLIAVGLTGPAFAGYLNDEMVIQAPVTHVEPLVRLVNVATPREVCWEEPVYQAAHRHRSKTPVVVGGIIGGAIGHAIGDSRRSKNLLTAAGALLGASIGRDHSYRHSPPPRRYVTTQRVCEIEQVVHQEERIDGYRVTYRYRGRSFVTHTATPPGATIPVRVQVEPLAYNDAYQPDNYSGRRPYRSRHYES